MTASQKVPVLSLSEPSTLISPQAGKESAPEVPREECGGSPHFSSLEDMVAHLVTSLQGGDSDFVLGFLGICQRFITTRQKLDMLFKRFSSFRPECEEDEQAKNTLCTLLDYWMDKFPAEFCKIEHLPILKRLKTYLIVNMPYSDLLLHGHFPF
ncbi:ral guanine nucleotide dissociation stimulator-like [Cricetulus griseus]|uniref:Ral guanine nucleotide dissociation stimulator-like n=1 Tax=Cricetulus griseus TaxID=10029 RepID=A0A9J7FPY3_CRIGR|nr:ral guanine nucleotide dissociation stimulator-like [Cricetulus griseus]